MGIMSPSLPQAAHHGQPPSPQRLPLLYYGLLLLLPQRSRSVCKAQAQEEARPPGLGRFSRTSTESLVLLGVALPPAAVARDQCWEWCFWFL